MAHTGFGRSFLPDNFHSREAEGEEYEAEELRSVPESITPRPPRSNRPSHRSASSRIGSGATPCFQPNQEDLSFSTGLEGHRWTPTQYEDEWQTTDQSPYVSSSMSSVTNLTSSRRSYTTRGSTTAGLTPTTPQCFPGEFVHSPVSYRVGHGTLPRYLPQAGAKGPHHLNYPHASQSDFAPDEHHGGEIYSSPHTGGHISSFSPPTQPSYDRGQCPGPGRGRRHRPKPSVHRSRGLSHDELGEVERWEEIDNNLRHMELIPRSPFVPYDFEQWLDHRAGRQDDEINEARRKTKIREETAGLNDIDPAFGGKRYSDGRTSVLSQPSIWQPHLEPQNMGYAMSDWPSYEEMREEGDERNTSRFGRFLGLPRSPSNGDANWKARPQIESTELDSVWALPTMETVQESRKKWEASDIAQGESLIGHNLMNGL